MRRGLGLKAEHSFGVSGAQCYSDYRKNKQLQMPTDSLTPSECPAVEFANLLFKGFVVDRLDAFLQGFDEGKPKPEPLFPERSRYGLLVACVILAYGFNGSPQDRIKESVSHFKLSACKVGEHVWELESFESELLDAVRLYSDIISQTRDEGRPELTWLNKEFKNMGVEITNAVTLLMIHNEMMDHFTLLSQFMKSVTIS